MPYQPDAAFAGLFRAFTSEPTSIGPELARLLDGQAADVPLLVSSASDIALFPGGGRAARLESFRKSTRGFIELTAVSHVPLALCYAAQMHALEPQGPRWRRVLQQLVEHAERTRAANTEAMWREHVDLRAFDGMEAKIVRLVEYTLALSVDFARRALADPARWLDFDTLRAHYLEGEAARLPVSMNDVMFATFCLAYVDIAWRIGNWLRGQAIDWPRAMVLVSGQSGRPTAGVTWSSNNICNLIWRSSDGRLPAEQLYVAPFAPGFTVDDIADAARAAELEARCRHLWWHTRASVLLARKMFVGAEGWSFTPATADAMPPISSLRDRQACSARLRRIMEDPQQLLSNCVADYVVEQLQRHGNRPDRVEIPGFSDVDFPAAPG